MMCCSSNVTQTFPLQFHLHRDGDDAFQAVRENKGAILVIMDVHMAIKDGIDATREIRFWEGSKRGTGEHLPIVALTGSTSPDVEQECLAAGMVSACNCTHSQHIFKLIFQKFSCFVRSTTHCIHNNSQHRSTELCCC
jgi:CheY-like chemotaxis protein